MAERTPRRSGRPQGNRPGTRKVVLPGSVATAPAPGDEEDAAKPGRGGGRRAGPPTRRSRFRFTKRRRWQALIAVEVLVALGVSQALIRDPEAFSLDGVEREAFCPAVRRFRLEGSGQPALTIESAPALYDSQVRAYRELGAAAPTDVRPDFEKLAGLSEGLAATARELLERQKQDHSFAAGLALTERQAQVTGGAVLPTRRVEESIRQACGIDVNEPLPTTTAPAPPPTTTPASTADPAPRPESTPPPEPGG